MAKKTTTKWRKINPRKVVLKYSAISIQGFCLTGLQSPVTTFIHSFIQFWHAPL